MANEKRLIDANAVLDKIRNSTASAATKVTAFVFVDTAPTVDAVEVCRCKDCEHGCEDHEDAYLCNNAYYGLMGFTRGDDFCSYGERRTDG